jgi:hypothetical protein
MESFSEVTGFCCATAAGVRTNRKHRKQKSTTDAFVILFLSILAFLSSL